MPQPSGQLASPLRTLVSLLLILWTVTGCLSTPAVVRSTPLTPPPPEVVISVLPMAEERDDSPSHNHYPSETERTNQPPSLPEITPSPAQPTVGLCVPPHDLWNRIRSNLVLTSSHHPEIEKRVRFYRNRPLFLEQTFNRASLWLRLIVEEAEARQLPLDLVLLPVVESAYKPLARSRSGAAGLWQFIPSTGLHFGLKQNHWYDGRRDVIAATDAAFDYLSILYHQFDRDWLLALAAYNAGEGRVAQEIRANLDAGKAIDFWSLDLPQETRNYVPKLLAIIRIVANPPAQGLVLKSIPDQQRLKRIEIGEQIDLDLVARLSGLSLNEIYFYNPGFKRRNTDPDGPHHLLLPAARAESFQQQLAQIPSSQWVTLRQYRVASGDLLGRIARRFNSSVAAIRRANRLEGDLIKVGEILNIPGADSENTTSSVITATTITDKPATKPTRTREHTVRSGESLWAIARLYSVSVAELRAWNEMQHGTLLKVGQPLRIEYPQAATTTAIAAVEENDSGSRTRKVHYTVRKGDSLSRISRRYRVSIKSLRHWNDLHQDDYLHPGDRLTLFITSEPILSNS
ncbi:MAG: LysM peptidoglycan-binding domain-containing protein [Gammaproteobacteria bacterium]|nr:LysM peptidoglycan-binding domain-containing protein [Gammaproteobacteria bacterium]